MHRNRRSDDDTTTWIGYSDFLMTLVVLFFLLFASAINGQGEPKDGIVEGRVVDFDTKAGIEGCHVALSPDPSTETRVNGEYKLIMRKLFQSVRPGLTASCANYLHYFKLVDIHRGATTKLDIELRKAEHAQAVSILEGDALFATGESKLKASAITDVKKVADKLNLKDLRGDEIIVVSGHTDDVKFTRRNKDNWILSGERAAAAARVLTDPVYGVNIDSCKVGIIGFGPTRPRERILQSDSESEKARKRKANRRIEFMRFSGVTDIFGKCQD